MRTLFAALLAAAALSGPVHSQTPDCPRPDAQRRDAAVVVLTNATDPQIAAWAGYLNARFYDDLDCRLPVGMTAEDVRALQDDPVQLIRLARLQAMNRNQSDALMLILSAMQSTQE